LGVSYPTAWLLKHKLMEVMRLREEGRQLTGRVEIDDAYLGGECPGGKPGRGSPNKVEFVAAVQTTESGEPVLMCLSKRAFTKESITEFAAKSLAAPATLVSDGLGCFTAVRGTGVLHEPHVTGGGTASAKHPSFQAVNTVLGNLKTALAGTYHAFGFEKYAHRYLAQVQYLFPSRGGGWRGANRPPPSQTPPCGIAAVGSSGATRRTSPRACDPGNRERIAS
jgi:hypothetical protein